MQTLRTRVELNLNSEIVKTLDTGTKKINLVHCGFRQGLPRIY